MYHFKIAGYHSQTMGWDSNRFTEQDSIMDDLKCSICMDILEEPVQAPCEHTFCKTCIQNWLDQGNRSCPVDRKVLSSDSLKPPTRITQQLLDKLTIRCKNHVDGCHLQCKLEYTQQLIQHEEKWCHAVDNEKKREIHELKSKIVELQEVVSDTVSALDTCERSIAAKDQLIKEQEDKISKLQKKAKNPMKTCKFSRSSPPPELLESTSTTPICSEAINQDLLQGTICIYTSCWHNILLKNYTENTCNLRTHTRQQQYHAYFNIMFHVWILNARILIVLSQKDVGRNIAL